MARHVAFLRAINVAGHAIVKMTDLKQAFVSAGCTSVETCIQSGNVVFEWAGKKSDVTGEIERALRDLIGGRPVVITRTEPQLRQLEEAAPFTCMNAAADVKWYEVFLAGKPRKRPTFPRILPKEELEAVAMTDREVFVVSRRKKNGFYGFPNAFVETELGVPATARNWSTVTKIVELLRKPPAIDEAQGVTAAAAARPRGSSSRRTARGRRR